MSIYKHLKKLNELHQDTYDSAKSKLLKNDDYKSILKKYPNAIKKGNVNFTKNYDGHEGDVIQGIVKVGLPDIINQNNEWFMDELSRLLIDDECLGDIQYDIIGCEDDMIILKVSGELPYWYNDED